MYIYIHMQPPLVLNTMHHGLGHHLPAPNWRLFFSPAKAAELSFQARFFIWAMASRCYGFNNVTMLCYVIYTLW